MRRREFLKTCGGSVAAGISGAPALFGADRDKQSSANEPFPRTLVLVELEGGCDWYNTLVPFNSPAYYRRRPNLAIPSDLVLRLNDSVGLHPSLGALKRLFDAGDLAVVSNIGFPEPVGSHYEARRKWHAPAPSTNAAEGWLRRWAARSSQEAFLKCVGSEVPPAMRLVDRAGLGNRKRTEQGTHAPACKPARVESTGSFVEDAELVALLMKDRLSSQGVYYLTLEGFDTHRNQVVPNDPIRGRHAELLRQLDDGVGALVEGAAMAGLGESLLVVVFSEFGRSLRENAEGGTEHGNLGNVLFFGKSVQGGVYDVKPNSDGVVGASFERQPTDFRRTHATILDQWFGTDSRDVLRETLQGFPFL